MRQRRYLSCLLVVAGIALVSATGQAQQVQFYVLDGFGGVHAGGGAPVITPATPYFGFDIAKGVAYAPGSTGEGYLVLDGFGGVHQGGSLGAVTATPYFGFDIARALAYRIIPPRANGAFLTDSYVISGGSWGSVASTTVNAPDDGFIFMTSSAEMFCSAVDVGGARTDVSLSVDSATTPTPSLDYLITIPDCSLVTAGAHERRTVAVSYLFSVAAGAHTVHLLAQDGSAPIQGSLSDITIVAIYIDHGFDGASAPAAAVVNADPVGSTRPEGVIAR